MPKQLTKLARRRDHPCSKVGAQQQVARPKVVHCVMRVGHIRGELQYPVVMAQRLHGQRRLTRLNLLKLSIMRACSSARYGNAL